MTNPAIHVSGLTKRYGDFYAVRDLSFSAAKGQLIGLLGGNGAGKTTTISMLLGILKPTSGQISVMGIDMINHRHQALAFMNFSSPYVDMPAKLTVRKNLIVFSHLYQVNHYKDRIDELAQELDLTAYLDKNYGDLSAGQKTRVSLAKALINTPQLLLLDEPTASLDPDTADWIRGYLQQYQTKTNATILMASHNMIEVERLCSRVMIMKQGKIVDDDTPAALIDKYGMIDLEHVFLDIARRTESESDNNV